MASSTEDTITATKAPTAQDDTNEAVRRSGAELVERGGVVGRYVVLSKLGAGGMGVVYAAYDPELDRKVALKLLLPAPEGGHASHTSEGRARLLREAQALAKLQHPNVVTIHDVGTHAERVWLAMEYVAGRTLGGWLDEKKRVWPEVLDVLLRAGRGVAAAHAAGLLHRDLKPDNIMVASDERVRVMDFGLARAEKSRASEGSPMADELMASSKLETLEHGITRAGALLGTPAYMAPEQFLGTEVSAATDQFSFCVTLWEALYGERPFAGSTLVELMTRVLDGERQPPPARTAARTPSWLRHVLEKGLSVEPEARWPSMDALLDALGRGRGRARRRRATALVGALGLFGASAWGWRALDRRNRAAACEDAGATIESAWNGEVRNRLYQAIIDTGVSHAERTANNLIPWLDDNAESWRAARTAVCRDAELHGTWDVALSERGLWCLEERRMQFESLVAELSRPDQASVHEAISAAANLDSAENCRQSDLLRRLPIPRKEQRENLQPVRLDLSRAVALSQLGKYDEGIERARASLERAQRLEWPPLAARAHLVLGELLGNAGEYAQSEVELEAAYFDAAAAGASGIAAEAADQLVITVGHRLARHEEGLRWSRHAEVMLASLSDFADVRRAYHIGAVGHIHRDRGAYDEAISHYELERSMLTRVFGPAHPSVARSLNNLADVQSSMGAYEDAINSAERGIAILEDVFGPQHPDVATGLNNLAAIHWATQAYDEARTAFERALAIRETALGPEHPFVAQTLHNMAFLHFGNGNLEQAQTLLDRALVIRVGALGRRHSDVAANLYALGLLHDAMGTPEQAEELFLEALAIWEVVVGPDHPHVVQALDNLGLVNLELGAYSRAESFFQRALAAGERVHGEGHPSLARALVGLAEIALEGGMASDAVQLAERAARLRENAEVAPEKVAKARFVLARALWEADRDRDRALELARLAREDHRKGGDANPRDATEIDAWIETHILQ